MTAVTTTTYSKLATAGWILSPFVGSSCIALLGYAAQDVPLKYRWVIGMALAKAQQHVNMAYVSPVYCSVLPPIWTDANLSMRLLFFSVVSYGLPFASAMSALFGGRKYHEKHGIDSLQKAALASVCMGQVYFKKNQNARKDAAYKSMKTAAVLCVGYSLTRLIANGTIPSKLIRQNTIVHMEVMAFLTSIAFFSINIPSNIYYLCLSGNDDVEVIEPYDLAYFSSSIRDFWKNWSRSVGDALRYMVYEPLGGRTRFWLAAPAMFCVNSILHYDLSMTLRGQRAMGAWNKSFALMAGAMVVYMYSEKLFPKGNRAKDDVYWKIWSVSLFHASMLPVLYIVLDEAMCINLQTACNTFQGPLQVTL